jgi:hypothetical protein
MSNSYDRIKLLLLEYIVLDVATIVLGYAIVNEGRIARILEGKIVSDLIGTVIDFWIDDGIVYTAAWNTIKIFNLSTHELIGQHEFTKGTYIDKIEVSKNTILIASREGDKRPCRQYDLSNWKLMRDIKCECYDYVRMCDENLFIINSRELAKRCDGLNTPHYFFNDIIVLSNTIFVQYERTIYRIDGYNVTMARTRDKIITSLFFYSNELYCRDFKGACYYVDFTSNKIDAVYLQGKKRDLKSLKGFPDGLFSINNGKLYEHPFKIY